MFPVLIFLLCAAGAAIHLSLPLIIGLPLNLPPWEIAVTTLVGGSAAVLVFLFRGDRLQARVERHLKSSPKREKSVERLRRLSAKYGTFGVGFIAPFIVGLFIAMGVGVLLNLPKRRLALYLILVVLIWSAVYAVIGYTTTSS